MMASLLKSDQIPSELRRVVQDKAEGNPFYLEELINSLIESNTFVRENGNWKLTRPIRDADISSTVHGIIAGRLDRLAREAKRLLREASVIGRSFLYEILIRKTPLAAKKAEHHLDEAVRVAKEIGAKGILGQAMLDLALLHKAKKKRDQARMCISEAIRIFEQCDAEVYLKQAKEVLKSMG